MSALEKPHRSHRPPLEDLDPLTDEQREAFLEVIRANPLVGNVTALRQTGLLNANGFTPTRGQIRRLFESEDGLDELVRVARGWNIVAAEDVLWRVAVDPDHPSWNRANERVLKAYLPQFRDSQQVEVEHTGVVRVEHERRLTIGDVIAARQLAGPGAGVGGELPAAREVLPASE